MPSDSGPTVRLSAVPWDAACRNGQYRPTPRDTSLTSQVQLTRHGGTVEFTHTRHPSQTPLTTKQATHSAATGAMGAYHSQILTTSHDPYINRRMSSSVPSVDENMNAGQYSH